MYVLDPSAIQRRDPGNDQKEHSSRSVLWNVLPISKLNSCRSAEGREIFSINYDDEAITVTYSCPATCWQRSQVLNSGTHPPTTNSWPTSWPSHRYFSPPQEESFSRDTSHLTRDTTLGQPWKAATFLEVLFMLSLLEMSLIHSLLKSQLRKKKKKSQLRTKGKWTSHRLHILKGSGSLIG